MPQFLATASAATLAPLGAIFFCLAASLFDLKRGRVPNSLNYAGFAAALAFPLSGRLPLGMLPQYAALLLLSFCLAFALFWLGAWGGGDAKFFVSLAAWLPSAAPWGVGNPLVFLHIFLAASLLVFAFLVFSKGLHAGGFLRASFAAVAAAGVEEFKTKRRLIAVRGKSVALAPFLSAGFLIAAALAGAGLL